MHSDWNSLARLGVFLLFGSSSLLQAQNLDFFPVADARVRQDMRMTNFATDELGVETDMRTPSARFERSFLRFVVTGVDPSQVDCVTLQLAVTVPGSSHFEVREVTGAWDEGTLTWANMPDGNGRRIGSWSAANLVAGDLLQIPLGPGIFAPGNGTYDLVLVETLGGGFTRTGFDSREGLLPPKLTFGCSGLPPRAGMSAQISEGEVPFTPEIRAFLPADVTSATWDFGDGSPPQVGLAPSHTYVTPGRYSLSVTADSPGGSVSVARPNFFHAHRADGQVGTLINMEQINAVTAISVLDLQDEDYFGRAVGAIGDLDGDGVIDLVVGAVGDDEAEDRAGAVYILFMRIDGTVRAATKITEGRGGFSGDLDIFDGFGREVAPIGDLDGDGILDIAVGANNDDDIALNSGAVYILFLNADGTVKSDAKITGAGVNSLNLNALDEFGRGIACIGDLNNDGVQDLAVGAIGDDQAGPNYGNVWILFMTSSGGVLQARSINLGQGGIKSEPVINPLGLWLGISVSPIGDVNLDGVCDIVVGAVLDNAIPQSSGGAYVLLLNREGGVRSDVLINGLPGGGLDYGEIWVNDQFGGAVAGIGDVDADGIPDIAVTSFYDDDNPAYRTDLFDEDGAFYVLFLNSDGTVRDYQKISATRGGLSPMNQVADRMGEGLAGLGDLNGDGSLEILVGSRFDDAGGQNRGSVRIMHLLGGDGTPAPNIIELGCGINPANSLLILSGTGRIGTSITFGVDNPLGTQAVGSVPFVALATAPDPNFPCGTQLNGFGMDGGPGELLIQFNPKPFRTLIGPAWTGAGNPAPIVLNIPPNSALVGFKLYVQGRMMDSTPGAQVRVGLAGAFEITLLP